MTDNARKILAEAVGKIAANYDESEILMLGDEEGALPDRKAIKMIIKDLRRILFPGYFDSNFSVGAPHEFYIGHNLADTYDKLYAEVKSTKV